MTPRLRQTNTHLLDSIGLELLKADPAERLADAGLKIEYIPAELIRPDPIQPRRVLPEQIHFAFHANRLTPTQALRELVQVAQVAARQNGRPFSGVLDLMPDDTEKEESESEPPQFSPEEQLVRDLVNLAVTIRDDGQVNPLTVVDVTQGVTRLYRIETGERRYWASWIIRDFLPGYEGDGTVPCIIIPSGKASIFRQAKENTARTGLSAVAMARQTALLILSVHGIEKPDGPVSNDFFRQALELDLRDKREFTSDILSAMGGISKVHFCHYKALLQLSDEAMELADRHCLDEKKLRYVVPLPPENHAEVVRQIISFNLTSAQVKQLCEQDLDGDSSTPETPSISKPALQVARLARGGGEVFAQDLARALLVQEHDVAVARARLVAIRKLIDDAERYLEANE
jgi:hypothetical protein